MDITRTFTCGPVELSMWLSDDTETFGMVVIDREHGIEIHHIAPSFSDYIDQLRQLENVAEWAEMLPPCDNCGQNANNLETHDMISCEPCHKRALKETFIIWLYDGQDNSGEYGSIQECMTAIGEMMADPTCHEYFPFRIRATNEYGDERYVGRVTLE